MAKTLCPKLRLIVSFADSAQGHHGGIYQAGGWIFTGDSFGRYIVTNGKTEHPRTLGSRFGIGGQSIRWLQQHIDPNAKQILADAKHRYLMPLDAEMRSRLEPLRKPYPKREKQATGSHQEHSGGAAPTLTLQTP